MLDSERLQCRQLVRQAGQRIAALRQYANSEYSKLANQAECEATSLLLRLVSLLETDSADELVNGHYRRIGGGVFRTESYLFPSNVTDWLMLTAQYDCEVVDILLHGQIYSVDESGPLRIGHIMIGADRFDVGFTRGIRCNVGMCIGVEVNNRGPESELVQVSVIVNRLECVDE